MNATLSLQIFYTCQAAENAKNTSPCPSTSYCNDKYTDRPVLQPRQVAGALALQSGERLSKLMVWKPSQFLISHESKANYRIRPEGLLFSGNFLENLPAAKQKFLVAKSVLI